MAVLNKSIAFPYSITSLSLKNAADMATLIMRPIPAFSAMENASMLYSCACFSKRVFFSDAGRC